MPWDAQSSYELNESLVHRDFLLKCARINSKFYIEIWKEGAYMKNIEHMMEYATMKMIS